METIFRMYRFNIVAECETIFARDIVEFTPCEIFKEVGMIDTVKNWPGTHYVVLSYSLN